MKRRIIRASNDNDHTAASNRMKAQVESLFDRSFGGKYLEAVYVRDTTGRPDIRIQLNILGASAVIYLYKTKPHMGTIECHPPKLVPVKNINGVRQYGQIMSTFVDIAETIYKGMEQEMKWEQFLGDDDDIVSSAAVTAATNVSYRVYQNYPDPDYPGEWLEDDCVNTFNNMDKAIEYAEKNTTPEVALSVVEVIGEDTQVIWTAWGEMIQSSYVAAAQDFVWVVYDEYGEYVCSYPADREGLAKLKAKELYKGTYKKEPLDEVESSVGVTASSDVTVDDLSDLMRASWEAANAEWGNTAEDLLEWEDAFYTDDSYRNGVAEYVLKNVPALKNCNMNQVHIVSEEDEDTSELMFTILIDGQPVDRVRTWYVGGRWDAFMDEL